MNYRFKLRKPKESIELYELLRNNDSNWTPYIIEPLDEWEIIEEETNVFLTNHEHRAENLLEYAKQRDCKIIGKYFFSSVPNLWNQTINVLIINQECYDTCNYSAISELIEADLKR